MQSSSRVITPFGSTSTSDDVIAGVDLGGRRAVVTGGGSGIGRETARALAAADAEVVLAQGAVVTVQLGLCAVTLY